jgi:hypothetical protein
MIQNLGNAYRIASAVAVVPLTACGFMAPFPFVLPALYIAFTVFGGTCLGYLMIGRSTCPVLSVQK